MPTFKIHPALGVARVGDSDSDFYLAPEQPGQLPTECDSQGQDQGKPVTQFKDARGRIKRQAARFRIYVYEDGAAGRELKQGDRFDFELETSTTGRQTVQGEVVDIEWTVHLANKKASWYTFKQTEGMHGYPADHPLRNASVDSPQARRNLIIDPGPQTAVYLSPNADPNKKRLPAAGRDDRHKYFAKGQNPGYPQSFPPDDIAPSPIDSLGEMIAHEQDNYLRLIVLGGFGNAGSTQPTPMITQYANNDGWFDDVSDGPVTARIKYRYDSTYYDDKGNLVTTKKFATSDVVVPAWVVVGYPRYVPEILDMITMTETMEDLFVRHFAANPRLFGVPPFSEEANTPKTAVERRLWQAEAQWNPNYYPRFYAEIWPILKRPDRFQWVYDFDPFQGGVPHNTGTGGDLDEAVMGTPPQKGVDDPKNRQLRQFVYNILRQPGQENLYRMPIVNPRNPNYRPRGMPELCGNNPLSNTAPDKFLRLTETQLFLLKQWADGNFVNECQEWGEGVADCRNPRPTLPLSGDELDRGVLGNVVGGAFCPGGELTWIMLNPAIYSEPFRIKHAQYQAGALSLPKIVADQDGSPAADLAAGLEPGDLTKYMALPWQADFTQCTEQPIDVTYENWVLLDLDTTGDPAQQALAANVPWWPAHRPMVVQDATQGQVYWASGIPENDAGGLRMATDWKYLGFLKGVEDPQSKQISYLLTERNEEKLGPLVKPGELRLGNTKKAA